MHYTVMYVQTRLKFKTLFTGKSLSETLILGSTNSQYIWQKIKYGGYEYATIGSVEHKGLLWKAVVLF